MKNTTEEKVFSFIREHRMLLPDDRVVAGISGGADSVCLLFVLLEWKRRYGLELLAVHVNHGIRPEAGEDARFVEELCARYEIPFVLRETDVPRLAAEENCTEEEAGRKFRYKTFAEAAEILAKGQAGDALEPKASDRRETSDVKIAVAHNLNDQSETMLFHLFRGSGIRGLAGMAPVRDHVIRPLLCLERSEIEAYLAEKGQDYRTDATNNEDHHTRNRIRHHILPYAQQEIVPGCVRHMGQTAGLLRETEDYLELQTKAALEECLIDGKEHIQLDHETFSSYHPALQKRMLYDLAKTLSPGAKDISYVHIEALQTLFSEEGNRRICLPFGILGRREYDRVILEGRRQTDPEKEPLSGISMKTEIFSVGDLPIKDEKTLLFPENRYTKWFDYDKIKKSPVLRTRRTGDYFLITDGEGVSHHKPLKEYMVTEKIPKDERERVPVLAEDSHVLWLVGYRISEYYKIDENTKRVLQVQLITDQ